MADRRNNLAAFGAVHGTRQSTCESGSKRSVLTAIKLRIVGENRFRVAPRLEEELNVLAQIAEAQPGSAGLARTAQFPRTSQLKIDFGNGEPVAGSRQCVEALPAIIASNQWFILLAPRSEC